MLEWACESETGSLRFLRPPQLRALETYWYLRLIEGTPHVADLYQRLFPVDDLASHIEALGVPEAAFKGRTTTSKLSTSASAPTTISCGASGSRPSVRR